MLLDKYKALNANPAAFKAYSETGTSSLGRIFQFKNTNYRTLYSFLENYQTFKAADGIARERWSVNSNGQEKLKQHTVNMAASHLFANVGAVYRHTHRGVVLEKIASLAQAKALSGAEVWLLVYLLILDANFANQPNYILQRTQVVFRNFRSYQPDTEVLLVMMRKFIQSFSETRNFVDVVESGSAYLYYDSFYARFGEFDFLADYVAASEDERSLLANYITDNYRAARWNIDCLCKKYKPSGSYDKNMLYDNAKLLFMSARILQEDFGNFSDFVAKMTKEYAAIATIDTSKIQQFIQQDADGVYEAVFLNIRKLGLT